MDELLARHRKELRDLQSVMTSKKKSASKKTRKGVNSECEQLEKELREKHEREVAELNGEASTKEEDGEEEDVLADILAKETQDNGKDELSEKLSSLTVEPSSSERGPKRNRQKERLARRAAEQAALQEQAEKEAALLPNLREQEQAALQKRFAELGLVEQDIPSDGHCLYSAFADQLEFVGKSLDRPSGLESAPGYKVMRRKCADFVKEHRDDFEPFLETESFEEHVHKIADTAEWGGQLEVSALAQVFGVTANIVQAQGRIEKLNEGREEEIWLAYHRHNFGLGEHYNSLRKKA